MRFVDDDGTARTTRPTPRYDGAAISQQLLATADFAVHVTPLLGGPPPTRVWRCSRDGSAGSTSRCPATTAATNAVACSDDSAVATSTPARPPRRPWESCRSATAAHRSRLDEGWLVLTHGVGADAHLLDRRDAPRPRRPERRARSHAPTADHAAARRAGRLRAQRPLHCGALRRRRPPRSCRSASPTAGIVRHARRSPTSSPRCDDRPRCPSTRPRPRRSRTDA